MAVLLLLLGSIRFAAEQPAVVPLWPEGVPGVIANAGPEASAGGRVSNVHQPTLTVYEAPDRGRTGTAIIVCPGGGYSGLAFDRDGRDVAAWLNSIGVSAFVLKYRLKEYGHPVPLRDVLRAIRLVREGSAKWHVDARRIGVIGFSAGGHLAATAGTLFDSPEGRTGAAMDRISARPDFMILVYPVITLKPPYAHKGSRDHLVGPNPSSELVDHLSAELQVSAATPPAFLVHGGTDQAVAPENSVLFYSALRRAGVPAELHAYEIGPHGFGVGTGQGPISGWTERAAEWLTARGLLPGRPAGALPPKADASVTWARGVEGQRKADLGNGQYLNPIFPGDHPDPSIIKDGDDYYITFSSFDAYPGLVIWHSRDLVNWEVLGPALFKDVGSVFAPDLVKHKGRYYIYFPGRRGPKGSSNYVIWADDIRGPWSDPIDLKIQGGDPGHAVGPDGKRYLFFGRGMVVPIADDGLSAAGEMKKVYDGWQYPKDWVVGGHALEGPKFFWHGAYCYLVSAQGGTAGPPTSHMVVAARAKSIEGPWENSPYNAIIHTRSASERWWSKGHATILEGPGGQWYAIYHGYENGFYTLGRQTLLEPIEWTEDGWFRATGVDVASPIAKPSGTAVPHGMRLSDDFSKNRMGVPWGFYQGGADRDRYRYENGALVLKAKGATPADCSPLSFVVGDHAYEVQVTADVDPGATAGLLVFYNRRLFAGLGFSTTNLVTYQSGIVRGSPPKPAGIDHTLRLRFVNDRQLLTIYYSADGQKWETMLSTMDVSGYHQNVMGEFLSLRPALFAAGTGEVRFRDFKYRALP